MLRNTLTLIATVLFSQLALAQPPAPEWVAASDGTYDNWIELKWSFVDDATHYLIQRRPADAKDAGWETVETKTSPKHFRDGFNDRENSPGVRYQYRFVAVGNDGVESVEASYDTGYRRAIALAPTPYFPKQGSLLEGETRFAWSPTQGKTEYRFMLVKAGEHTWDSQQGLVGEVLVDTTLQASGLDINVASLPNTEAVWSVQARDGKGKGSFSDPIEVRILSDNMDATPPNKQPSLNIPSANVKGADGIYNISFTLANNSDKNLEGAKVIALYSENKELDFNMDVKLAEQAFNPILPASTKDWEWTISLEEEQQQGHIILLPFKDGKYIRNGMRVITLE